MKHIPYPKHLYQTPIYKAWSDMKTRCNNPKFIEYHRYGGRGITYCARWEQFANFYADMGASHQPGLTLDRIDNDAPYSPQNCKWSTRVEQCSNRRTTRLFTIRGETHTLAEWIRRSNVKRSTVSMRLKYNWPIERALGMED